MGAPLRNKNASKFKDWCDALHWTLDNYASNGIAKGQALREIAKALIEKALDGDMTAVKEIGNRLDGKAVTIIAGDDEAPLQTEVRLTFVDGPKEFKE